MSHKNRLRKGSFGQKVTRKIYRLKHSAFGSVSIDCDFNGLRYRLVLLTAECSGDRYLMKLLGDWRRTNEAWFQAQFRVTLKRTIKWFKEKVTGSPDRLLFLIKAGGKYIGHVGLAKFDFAKRECDIDSILRGRSGYPGAVGDAITNMMRWGRKTLGLRSFRLTMGSDNERAMCLYKRLGFREVTRTPRVHVQTPDGMDWAAAPRGYKKKIKRYHVHMRLVR